MRNILLALPEELLIEIDDAANEAFSYRSEYIRKVLFEAVANREAKAVNKARRENPVDPRLLNLDDS